MPESSSATPTRADEVAVRSLQAFLAAAAVHMGDALADGSKLLEGDPVEAWIALVSADALVTQLAPAMPDDEAEGFRHTIQQLSERLVATFPEAQLPVPGPLSTSLEAMLRQTWSREAAANRPEMPGLGLPRHGTGPLF